MTEIQAENTEIPGKFLSRVDILEITTLTIREIRKKAASGRIKDAENERIRDGKIRLLLESCKVHAGILKDHDLSDLEKRIAKLEGEKK